MTKHFPGEVKKCVSCKKSMILAVNANDLIYCTNCKIDTIYLNENEQEEMYDYACEKCGHEIWSSENNDSILKNCTVCGKWNNFLRKDNNDMSRKKHKHKHKYHTAYTKSFYCQTCSHEVTETSAFKNTICLFRWCPNCKKQQDFKPQKPELNIPDQIIEKYFKVYPLNKEEEQPTEEVQLSLYE
jgi:predicted RNA-binding Zn-ribbon protein involved in translation (DUF1610 family)